MHGSLPDVISAVWHDVQELRMKHANGDALAPADLVIPPVPALSTEESAYKGLLLSVSEFLRHFGSRLGLTPLALGDLQALIEQDCDTSSKLGVTVFKLVQVCHGVVYPLHEFTRVTCVAHCC
jgi:DDT domain